MRVFNEQKTQQLYDYDLSKGYLKDDKLFIASHKEVKAVEGKYHYEVIKQYPSGGRDMVKVWDIEPVEGKKAYDEYEDIQVFIPYTEEEIEQKKIERYESLVSQYIREKYSLNAELAILRQRDSKPIEFQEYNDYAEQCKARAKQIL